MFEILNILIKLLCVMMKLFVCKEPLHVTKTKKKPFELAALS